MDRINSTFSANRNQHENSFYVDRTWCPIVNIEILGSYPESVIFENGNIEIDITGIKDDMLITFDIVATTVGD